MSESDKSVVQAGQGVAASAAGAGVGLALGGTPATTIAGALTGPTLLLAQRLRERAVHRREQSAAGAIDVAAEIVGGLDVLEERATSTDERIELVGKVIEAAAHTALPKKIRALGRILAEGLEPDGDVDEATVLALALDDMEAMHVHVLHEMATAMRDQPTADGQVERVPVDGWNASSVTEYFPTVGVTDAVFAVLVAHGLVAEQYAGTYGAIGPAGYGVSPVGHRCLFLLGEEQRD